MSSNRPEVKIAGRRLRTGVAWWLALALVLALANLVHSPSPPWLKSPASSTMPATSSAPSLRPLSRQDRGP